MIKNYSVRTDLALEEKERFESDHVEISGVVLEEDYDEASELRVTRVEIKTENGAKAMGKPVGTYLTIETPNLAMPDEKSQTVIAEKATPRPASLARQHPRTRRPATEGRTETAAPPVQVSPKRRSSTPASPRADNKVAVEYGLFSRARGGRCRLRLGVEGAAFG